MNLKPTYLLRTFLLLLFFICFSHLSIFAQERSNYKLLWKIEGNGLIEPSYLFGTMHVEDSRAFQFSDAVLPALEQSKIFALEVQPDSLLLEMSRKKIDTIAEEQFKLILNEDEYQSVVERFIEVNGYSFEDSVVIDPNEVLMKLIPIEEKADDKSVFVDFYLLDHAKTMRKDIAGLESITPHLYEFENSTTEEKRESILSLLEYSVDNQKSELDDLTEIYYNGDINEIETVFESYGGFDDVMKARNEEMFINMKQLMHQNSLFSAIGVAHLPGKDGVIALLQNDGYTVTPVEANFTGVAETYHIDESKMKWHTFEDTELGYTIETPQAPNFTEDFPEFKVYLYRGISSKISYTYLAYDLRNISGENLNSEFSERFMNSMSKNYAGTVTTQKSEAVNDGILSSTIIENDEDNLLIKFNGFLKNGILYFYGVEMDKSQVDNPSVSRFLNSLKVTKPKDKKPITWTTFKHEKGAFSIDIPGELTDVSREIPNPLAPDSEPYHYYLYELKDLKNFNYYIIRYNDMPTGYYLSDKSQSFDAVENNFEGKAEFVTEPKVIELDGYEGREYEVLIQGKYHSIIRVYIRGNRMYMILAQKLNVLDKISTDDRYLSSFKLEDYLPTETKVYKPENDTFQINFFDNVTTLKDTIGYEITYVKDYNYHYSKNPNTGGLYQINQSNLQDYFKIKNLNEFYKEHINNYLYWTDSIIKQEEIKIDNKDAMAFWSQNKNTKEVERYQLLLDNNQLYTMIAYLSKEEHQEALVDSIFNSFKSDSDYTNKNPFDWYSSKTDSILKDLHSKDSLIVKKAIGAFEYYEFEKSDLPKLYKSLQQNYSDTLYSNQIKRKIIESFITVNDSSSLEIIKNVYNQPDTNEELKADIIAVIPQIKDQNAYDVYKQLLLESPPLSPNSNYWRILMPFRDSTAFAINNFNILTSLSQHKNYISTVLNISSNIINENTNNKPLVVEAQSKLLKFAKQDLENYIKTINDTLDDYNNYYLINNYLSLFNEMAEDLPITDTFTKAILEAEADEWLKVNALTSRIRSKQSFNKKMATKFMDSLYYRFEIMKAYHDANRFKDIPSKYIKTDSFVELSLHSYLSQDDYLPATNELLGTIVKNNQNFHIYKLTYNEDEGKLTSYIASVGPIDTLSQDKELELFSIYSDWEILDEANWEVQAGKLITNTLSEN